MINLTRQQWKDLSKKCGKDWRVLKDTLLQVESEALNKGVDVGIESTKSAVIDVVRDTLNSDFGFGPKRLKQFNDAFRNHLNSATARKYNKPSTQQIILTESESDTVKVLIAMSKFLETTLSNRTVLTENEELRNCVNQAYSGINNTITIVRNSISENDMMQIIDDLKDTCLYLAPSVLEGEKHEA